jgi:drug/metabolite transporter (DMT)-like permease
MNARQWVSFLFLTVIWGSSFMWIKIAVQEIGPFKVVSIRMMFAVLILFVILKARKIAAPKTWKMRGILLLQGMISATIPWVLITWAEQYIDSAVATIYNGTVPMFTMIIAHIFVSDDRMTIRKVLGLLLGFAGVIVLVQNSFFHGNGNGSASHMVLLGQGAMLLAAIFYGISNVYARIKLHSVPPVFQAFYTILYAGMILWVATPVIESPLVLPVKPVTWVAIAWLGILGAGLSYIMFYRLLHEIGPTRVSLVTYSIPVVGVSLGVIFLKEQLSWYLIVGAILIVSGIWGVNKRQK